NWAGGRQAPQERSLSVRARLAWMLLERRSLRHRAHQPASPCPRRHPSRGRAPHVGSEQHGGQQLAYAFLEAAYTGGLAPEHAYLALITPGAGPPSGTPGAALRSQGWSATWRGWAGARRVGLGPAPDRW